MVSSSDLPGRSPSSARTWTVSINGSRRASSCTCTKHRLWGHRFTQKMQKTLTFLAEADVNGIKISWIWQRDWACRKGLHGLLFATRLASWWRMLIQHRNWYKLSLSVSQIIDINLHVDDMKLQDKDGCRDGNCIQAVFGSTNAIAILDVAPKYYPQKMSFAPNKTQSHLNETKWNSINISLPQYVFICVCCRSLVYFAEGFYLLTLNDHGSVWSDAHSSHHKTMCISCTSIAFW